MKVNVLKFAKAEVRRIDGRGTGEGRAVLMKAKGGRYCGALK